MSIVSRRRPRIAVVVQRYGLEVNGGAEQHARWLAEQLVPRAEMHAVTTCALDYRTWADHYPPGEDDLNGVRLHRFPVDAPRDWNRATRRTAALFRNPHSPFDEMQWVKDQGPYSSELLRHLVKRYRDTDAFIFFTFVYATTCFGLPLVSDKAILTPTAHDDPFLHLSVYRPLFHLPYAIAYNTLPERELVERVVHNAHVRNVIAGVGVSPPADVSGERFRRKYGLEGDFLLYVGRIDDSKNVPELLDHFMAYRKEKGDDRPLKLALLGKSHLKLPDRPDIIHPGFVSEEDKFDAIRAAAVVVLPSIYESLSMITLEAWSVGTPMLVNGRCEVVRRLAGQSNGGLYYYNYEEFAAALDALLASEALRRQLGLQGQRFVTAEYAPQVVVERYWNLLEGLFDRQAHARAQRG